MPKKSVTKILTEPKPKIVVESKGMISLHNEGTYIIYDKTHNIIVSDDNGKTAFDKALEKGYTRENISIAYNNKNKSLCLW
ncbi:MAG: hypothetical protein WC955_03980 [Elusimicrobiota bacterium]